MNTDTFTVNLDTQDEFSVELNTNLFEQKIDFATEDVYLVTEFS